MRERKGLLSGGWTVVANNKRYVGWFYLLNLLFGLFGTIAFVNQAGSILDHSLLADRLLHGLDVGVLMDMFGRPEFGPTIASRAPAMLFALVFWGATALFLPGVLQGFAATYRLPREDFFRACGRNLWRFIRLLLIAGVVMIALSTALFSLHGLLEKKAAESTNELLLPEVRLAGLAVIFLVMAVVRIWFDLAQTDVVLSDQRAVRKSIWSGFRNVSRNLGRLLGSYVVITFVAAVILLAGLFVWMKFVPPAGVLGAFLVSQATLLLLLIPRFWQRGVAVTFYLQNMVEPVGVVAIAPPEPSPAGIEPVGSSRIPNAPPDSPDLNSL